MKITRSYKNQSDKSNKHEKLSFENCIIQFRGKTIEDDERRAVLL